MLRIIFVLYFFLYNSVLIIFFSGGALCYCLLAASGSYVSSVFACTSLSLSANCSISNSSFKHWRKNSQISASISPICCGTIPLIRLNALSGRQPIFVRRCLIGWRPNFYKSRNIYFISGSFWCSLGVSIYCLHDTSRRPCILRIKREVLCNGCNYANSFNLKFQHAYWLVWYYSAHNNPFTNF